MSINASWDNEECTIIHLYFGKQWNLEDLLIVEQTTSKMLSEVPDHIIDVIINVEDPLSWPNNSFSSFKNILKRINQGNGLKVIVGTNTFLETLFSTLSKSNKEFAEGLTFVDSLQDARELLSK